MKVANWREIVEHAALGDDSQARKTFLEKHKSKVIPVVTRIADFYEEFDARGGHWVDNPRSKTTIQFLFAAGNCTLTSLHLFVSCLPLPGGHLMRQSAEAMAMTLMCATPACGVLEAYLKDPLKYPIHKAVDQLTKKKMSAAIATHLRFDPSAWHSLQIFVSFLNGFSHTSPIALGTHIRLGARAEGIVLVSDYDPKKFKFYRNQLLHLGVIATNLVSLVKRVDTVLR